MKKLVVVLGTVLAWSALAGCGAPEGASIEERQQAFTASYTSPFGTAPVNVWIGLWDIEDDPYLVYQRRSDGACKIWLLGLGGVIINSHYIELSPGSDYARIIQTGGSATITCTSVLGGGVGGTWHFTGAPQAPYSPQYGPTNITIRGGAGDDTILCNNNSDPRNNNTNSCFGDDGNDFVGADTATNMFLYGGAGDDKVYSPVSGPGLYLFGEAGNDCLETGPGGTTGAYNCGTGAGDRSAGSLGAGCEFTINTCLGD
jgi:hypothetical protein